MLNTDVGTPYTEIKETMIKYFKTGTLFQSLRKQQQGASSGSGGPTPMETDAVWRHLKGKSKGKKEKNIIAC